MAYILMCVRRMCRRISVSFWYHTKMLLLQPFKHILRHHDECMSNRSFQLVQLQKQFLFLFSFVIRARFLFLSATFFLDSFNNVICFCFVMFHCVYFCLTLPRNLHVKIIVVWVVIVHHEMLFQCFIIGFCHEIGVDKNT